MNRKNYKHGSYVDAEPNPHVDIKKYVTKDGKDDGKRYRVPDSEMKVSKKKRKGLGLMGGPSPAKMARPGLGGQQARKKQDKKKKKLMTADEFFKIKDSKQQFTGPKSTKGSLGDDINRFRKMDDDIKRVQKLSKGGRTGYKGGGMSQRGLGRAFMKGGKV